MGNPEVAADRNRRLSKPGAIRPSARQHCSTVVVHPATQVPAGHDVTLRTRSLPPHANHSVCCIIQNIVQEFSYTHNHFLQCVYFFKTVRFYHVVTFFKAFSFFNSFSFSHAFSFFKTVCSPKHLIYSMPYFLPCIQFLQISPFLACIQFLQCIYFILNSLCVGRGCCVCMSVW